MRKIVTIIIIVAVAISITTIFLKRFNSSNTDLGFEDKNGNAIWDDVDSFIKENSKNEYQRKALEQFFKVMQDNLVNPERCEDIKNKKILDDVEKAAACLRLINSKYGGLPDATKIEDAIVNSVARARAYNSYNSSCSGGVYPLWDEKKQGGPCEFEFK